MNLSPAESHYVLQRLMSQGKVRQNQVRAVLNGRARELKDLRAQIAALEGIGGSPRGARRGRPARRGRGAARVRAKRRVNLSPKVRALRQLQGKYMGYVRRLKPAEKARVRSVREKQGMQAAIRLASSLATRAA